jgi:hypothetical protein
VLPHLSKGSTGQIKLHQQIKTSARDAAVVDSAGIMDCDNCCRV